MRRRAEPDAPLARAGFKVVRSLLTGRYFEQRDLSQKLPPQSQAVEFRRDVDGEVQLVVLHGVPFDVARDNAGRVLDVRARP